MATYVIILLCIKVFFQHFHTTAGSAHWVVTEDGKIQSQIDSMLNMRRPYDLVAFMRQEDRSIMLGDLKEELLSRKDEIDKNEERDTVGLEQKFYKTDHDCIAAGKLLPDFDLYISTVLPLENKGIRPEEHIDLTSEPTASPLPPDCSIVTELDYSAHAFEHLEGMKERQTLSGQPELGLRNAIIYQDNVDDYGHRVYEAMKHNKTSWVLYDMAAFYWRIKGDPYHAIECVRRALHFSPRQQKDVALISLANVLHRARYSNEAAIVVHAALDISKELNVNHFTLGNIYAVLGDYNKSVICFENTLKIQPDFEAASKRKYAVLCHAKLENALEDQHRSLQQTLNDLKDYQRKHDYWQQQSEKLLSEQVSSDVKMDQHVAYEQIRLRDASAELGDYCHVVEQEGREVLLCAWNKKGPGIDHSFTSFTEHQDVFPTEHRDMFPQEPSPDNRKRKIKEKNGKPAVDYSQPLRPLKYTKDRLERPKYGGAAAETMADNWPSKDECDSFVQKVPDPRNLSTVYLSPENKGFEVKALLTEAQDLEPEAEHPLPWYPPICVPIMVIPEGNHKTFDHLKSIGFEERTKMTQKLADTSMKQIMLDHVDGIVTEEEVGQRILTALKESIGPSWILYNLAGLYWRIIGNNYHGIECIRRSLYDIPDQYRDVPLVNLATILYRWGRFDDAVVLMKAALSVNDLEPSSHYFFGNVLWATQNYTGAIKHYQTSLDIEPENQEVYNTLRAIKCYQKYHHATQSAAPQDVQTHHVGRNCHPRPSNSNTNDGGHTESRVLCKSEKGEEKCIIETRTRMKASECEGHCTQTCTITPIKIETCGGPELNAEGPIPNFGGDGQCIEKGAALHQNTGSEEGIFGGDFSSKLDEVSENYQKKGLCLGDDCNKLRVQQGGQKPHIKLDFVNGILHQKFIFVQSSNELPVEPHECVIFNDGSKSSGCSQPEFRTYRPHY